MLLYTGSHKLRLDNSDLANVDWASISASAPSRLKVWFDGELIEDLFVGIHSPYQWWGSNPLLSRPLKPTSVIDIEIGGDAVMRIEGNLVVDAR